MEQGSLYTFQLIYMSSEEKVMQFTMRSSKRWIFVLLHQRLQHTNNQTSPQGWWWNFEISIMNTRQKVASSLWFLNNERQTHYINQGQWFHPLNNTWPWLMCRTSHVSNLLGPLLKKIWSWWTIEMYGSLKAFKSFVKYKNQNLKG